MKGYRTKRPLKWQLSAPLHPIFTQAQSSSQHALKRNRALIPTFRLFSKYPFQTPFTLGKSLPENIHPSASLHLLPDPVLCSFFFLPALTSILALLQVKVIQRIYTSKWNTSWTGDLERLMLTLTFNREAPPPSQHTLLPPDPNGKQHKSKGPQPLGTCCLHGWYPASVLEMKAAVISSVLCKWDAGLWLLASCQEKKNQNKTHHPCQYELCVDQETQLSEFA